MIGEVTHHCGARQPLARPAFFFISSSRHRHKSRGSHPMARRPPQCFSFQKAKIFLLLPLLCIQISLPLHRIRGITHNTDILRGGAVVARWAHNPKVSRSSRLPATKVYPTNRKDILRGGAVVARWAHNPKVSRSSRLPATKVYSLSVLTEGLFYLPSLHQKSPLPSSPPRHRAKKSVAMGATSHCHRQLTDARQNPTLCGQCLSFSISLPSG